MTFANQLKNAKIAALSIAMIFGLAVECLQCSRANAAEYETALVAGGCFWCVESDFESVPGVIEAVSGFAGGHVENPTYKQVTRGGTGHLEVVEIRYDPLQVTYEQIVHLFLRSIDSTDAGGQFCDRGESYTTAIFALSGDQQAIAQKVKQQAEAELGQTIVTPIREAAEFYPADDYHQDFYRGESLILTRYGPRSKATAYQLYRDSCGRDERVRALWGEDAPFIGS